MKKLFLILFCLLLPLFAQTITHLRIEGAIGPASSAYVKSAFAYAQEKDSSAVVISLDTPGGLASSMREIIQEILNSPRPVIIYVSPSGAQAASAGTYILYASHIAVMAPGTNLGAATPVSMISPTNIDQNLSSGPMEKKILNDSAAYIISLAQLRDRNITWAEEAVIEGKSTSAQDALRYGVIDLIAASEKELFEKLEGREVQISGKSVILSFKEAQHLYYEPDWKHRFLSIITNPNIAYILLMLGVYGIFFELMNPGSIYPGIIGLISGVMALYALNLLPFSYAGLLLIAIGIALMITEIFVSGFGIFGIAGVVSFALGSVLLFDADTLGEGVSLPLIIAFSIASLAFFLLLLRFVFSSRSARIVSGAEEMISLPAEVIEKEGAFYQVRCHGEIWRATSQAELRVGDIAYVDAVNDLTLILRSKP
jgi:membrane-bound serine protease (ClpP class)